MQLSLFLHHHHHPMLLHNYCPLNSLHFTRTQTRLYNRNSYKIDEGRRALLSCLLITTFSVSGVYACDDAEAVSTSRRALRGAKIPESDFTTLPNGLKYYDLKVGQGAEAVKGSRVAVHYVAKWRGITFMTSRQGMGVGGGTPYGFDVGESERGNVLKGLDLGVQGMRVGGQRLLIVPPELAYGKKGVQEIPPNATIELDVELLSIKQSPFGTAVKIVEG
ncbi:peptidyl-prolyl cis-trans isomerase FKBP16-4, chloroplastic isoform X3 [Arachis ipaensis]|uniref:peptidyl-prolyl cis-trans isomerase FKBP16-4, chloroplastic isoform X3 n=1 Tax=Arachis ipaensis TaxID=130454 RepID=UPI0007AFDFC3|nr:peptidyl-prolyl cis-trans isomerase FKBP16-4, chloroplastic isoform X3 [Arachis ipaensis]